MNRRLFLWFLGGLSSGLPILHGEPVAIRTSELPWAMVGAEYHYMIETGVDGSCPAGDVNLSLIDGSLPDGLEIRGGYLLGTPRKTGTYGFSVRAANSCASAVKTLELVVTGKPILRAFPEKVAFEHRAGKASPAPLSVEVSATWPNLPYTVHADAGWLTHKVRAGATPGADSGLSSDVVSLEVDPKDLPPGVYRASVRFSTWLGANSPVVAVTLTVLP
jgi:hypothetical protein